jgi:uncharacterized protein YjbI with pentapeptide repeats
MNQANLQDVNLVRADLSGANLNGADLRRANLYRANLSGADLNDTNLRGADLSRAILTGTALNNARYNTDRQKFREITRWPEEFDPAVTGAVQDNE